MLASDIARPGDIWLFECRTVREAGFPGWFGDFITVNTQKLYCTGPLGLYLGSHKFRHAGIVVEWQGELWLLEWMPGGMHMTRVNKRQAQEEGLIKGIPLNDKYKPFFKPDLVARWIELHKGWHYRWGGLIFALVKRWSSPFAKWLRCMFGFSEEDVFAFYCVEAIVSLLLALGIWPRHLAGTEGRQVVMQPMLSDGYAPCEISEAPQFARNKMYAL